MIENLGMKPFLAGVETGNTLRRLAMLEEAARQEREQRDYTMGKARTSDAVLREVIGRAGGKKTAEDILNEISVAAQRSPEGAASAYELLKSLNPVLRQQLAAEALKMKQAEMELDVRKAGLTEAAKERAGLPWWERKEGIKHYNELDKQGSKAFLDAFGKGGKEPATEYITLPDGSTAVVVKNRHDIVLKKYPVGSDTGTYTDEYFKWKFGDDPGVDRLRSAVMADPAIPKEKKNETVLHLLNSPKEAADYIVRKEQQAKSALNGKPATEAGAPFGDEQPGFISRAFNRIMGRSETPAPVLSNPDYQPEEMFAVAPSSSTGGNPLQYLQSLQGGDAAPEMSYPAGMSGADMFATAPSKPTNPFEILKDLWTRKQSKFVTPLLPGY